MIRSLLAITLVLGFTASQQYVQQQRTGAVQQQPVQSVQAAQPDAIDQIPAWYQMAKPVASRAQQLPQASPSYYERIEPTYEQRRGEQPTYERPGIQTNQYANYPSYQNRQPYENLNALTSGASLSNLQASRRYPSGASGAAGGSDVPYDSALKRYHKLLLKRRQWTTKIGRILASTTPMTPSTVVPTTTTTTTQAPTTTTKKMPKSLKSIYSTIVAKTTTTTEEPTKAPATTTQATSRVTGRLVGKPRGTFKPHGTRKGWRMWKKVTPKYAGKSSVTTTEVPVTSTTIPTEPSTSVSSSSTSASTTPELPIIEETEEREVTEASTSTTTTTAEPSTTATTTTTTTTEEPTTTTKGSEEQLGGKGPSPLRYICRHKAGSNEHDPFSERRASTIGPFRPITVGHKWKPLRFKKPEPVDEVATVPATTSNKTSISTRPKGLRLLEYLLKQTDKFAKGLQKAINGPNTELLAAIKDVVAKFKASLDEAGIDQDVRLMGNQLKNTWQQLRTGTTQQGLDRGVKAVRQSAESSVTHFNYGPQPPQPQPVQIPYHRQHHHHPAVHRYTPGPMNEQIGRLFEKAVADAADQKTQQQIQQVQQQMVGSRP
ncbi:Prion-like-(Q/N-rich)-domain-bearing protein [Caenorhabditis elegans]|uniref:Prion-like-(Q/N-rich)-domain-bearing protein n=1 Tax=Caenorhabditis elegans TaxID=6239 RepID=H9G2X6_CAEEL|nr:Prion-like-(Q/N-rich)-domain-bearing protein [Caenorhabditis elegans]CCG28051.1 Prion-like-(Q/N-rich)-domain-bearing protein [Caenorhabditis elegans]|eukprot:NP_001256255.1 Uncharacterized protein CELE_D1054.9 [Caenorhabditis elegans]